MKLQKQVNIHEAKTQLSKLLKQVALGEEVIIAKAGKPVAKLVPFMEPPPARRTLGENRGKILWISPDFDKEDPELTALFEDGPFEPPGR